MRVSILQPKKGLWLTFFSHLSVFVSLRFLSDPHFTMTPMMWKLRLPNSFRAPGLVRCLAGISAWTCQPHLLRSTEKGGWGKGPPRWTEVSWKGRGAWGAAPNLGWKTLEP